MAALFFYNFVLMFLYLYICFAFFCIATFYILLTVHHVMILGE